MKVRRVQEIILPYRTNMPLSHAVLFNDKISRAIQIMLDNDLHSIAVVRKHRPIGMVRLKDALLALGLQTVAGSRD